VSLPNQTAIQTWKDYLYADAVKVAQKGSGSATVLFTGGGRFRKQQVDHHPLIRADDGAQSYICPPSSGVRQRIMSRMTFLWRVGIRSPYFLM